MSQPNYDRLLRPPKSSFFLFGMRGVGKSSWVNRLGLADVQIDFLREDLYQHILADPAVFSSLLERCPPGSTVFVDEIQRLPSVLNEVHRAIESRKLKFILTGSSARKLRRGGANLLGGRALLVEMHPLMPEEMGSDFDLETALAHGTLPLIVTTVPEERSLRLKTYVQTYLKEEIQAEALVRNLAGFARFLPIAGLLNGQVLNISSISRDCGVERTTVAGFIEILRDTLLAFELPGYEARLRVKERKHPKLYWADNGVARAARRDFGDLAAEERGSLFESWIAQLLKAYQSYRGAFDDFYYWAPTEAKDVEVDFLLKKGRSFVAIEAKSGVRYRGDWLKNLRAISGLKGLRRRLVVYGGKESLKSEDGIEILTHDDFCRVLEKDGFF